VVAPLLFNCLHKEEVDMHNSTSMGA
jgi:hypothetical protein